jgi:hypothetical protein
VTDLEVERDSMITKKLLKAQTFFKKNVQEFIESVGATNNNDGFILNTPIGQLSIHIYECFYQGREQSLQWQVELALPR